MALSERSSRAPETPIRSFSGSGPVEARVDSDFGADSWSLGERTIDLRRRPFLMGILNVTPDSFYDGGEYDVPAAAIARAQALVAEGADCLDIGAESTRPGAEDVAPAVQIRRLSPVVRALRHLDVPLSIDTRSASVADATLELGARIVNDVSALSDPGMAKIAAEHGASLVLMHALGAPKTMQINPRYGDVVREVVAHLRERMNRAADAGVDPARIALDPGIGFGKRPADNLELIASARALRALGRPVLLGVSRKSFLGTVGGGESPADRLAASLAATVIAWQEGVRIFRTHDPAETRKALAAVIALEPFARDGALGAGGGAR
jgi:dihydropteroate synthase